MIFLIIFFVISFKVNIDKVWKFADPEEIVSLKDQNESLKSVIKEMRTQMEILGQELPSPEKNQDPSSTAGGKKKYSLILNASIIFDIFLMIGQYSNVILIVFIILEYVQSLENEARALRKRNRELEHDLDTYRKYGRAPPVAPSSREQEEEAMAEVKDNSAVRTHIQSLNDQIGKSKNDQSLHVYCRDFCLERLV